MAPLTHFEDMGNNQFLIVSCSDLSYLCSQVSRTQCLCLCSVVCAVGDALLVTGVALPPVVNGCEQRCCCLLDGLRRQPWQKATHQKTELDPKPGNPFDSRILCV